MTKKKQHGGLRDGSGRKRKYGERLIQKGIPESSVPELEIALDALAKAVAGENPIEKLPKIRHMIETPYLSDTVSAGSPSEADVVFEDYVDINDLIGFRDGAKYVARVSGESMIDAGILPGDRLAVEPRDDAPPNSIVIAAVDGGMTVKRLVVENGETFLRSENKSQPDFADTTYTDGLIRGVVHGLVRQF